MINKLLSVKFIISVLLTLTFVYLNIVGKSNAEFNSIYTMIIGFYFGASVTKQNQQ